MNKLIKYSIFQIRHLKFEINVNLIIIQLSITKNNWLNAQYEKCVTK